MEEFLSRCFYQAVGWAGQVAGSTVVAMQWSVPCSATRQRPLLQPGNPAAPQPPQQTHTAAAQPLGTLQHAALFAPTTTAAPHHPHRPPQPPLRTHTLQGQYASDDDFGALDARMRQTEGSLKKADRLFYLSIPPNIFTAVAACASKSASSK